MIESHAVLMFWPSSAHARVRGSGVIASSHRLMKLLWTMVCETLVLAKTTIMVRLVSKRSMAKCWEWGHSEQVDVRDEG